MTFGGLKSVWYERPLPLWIQRPPMRSLSSSSSIANSTTLVMALPSAASSSASFSACGTVRGKPSSAKPLAHAFEPRFSRMMPTTMSSLTSPPAFITRSASLPISVPADTAARSMSPVARWHTQYSSTSFGDCVPLPQPGGPTRIVRLRGVEWGWSGV